MNRVIVTQKKTVAIIQKLQELYKQIPQTVGCIDQISRVGGCQGWCCKTQNPSVLYVQFLNSWTYIMSNWNQQKIVNLIQRSLWNYLSDNTAKGCVFFDNDSKQCTQHNSRPFNCRTYCQIPDEQFKQRKNNIQGRTSKNISLTVIQDQCRIPKVVGTPLTRQQQDSIWNRLKQVQKFSGIPQSEIHDGISGSYRTYHDHILLHIIPSDIMRSFQIVRVHGDMQQKMSSVLQFMSFFKSNLAKVGEQVIQKAKKRQPQVLVNDSAMSQLDKYLANIEKNVAAKIVAPNQKKKGRKNNTQKFKVVQRKPKKNRKGW